jgi:UDP:flavonoid glycosyltransferase YjiC (YdhE family)
LASLGLLAVAGSLRLKRVRFLFSSTRGAGHLQPLLPYANALVERGHDVLVAGPQDLGSALQTAGLKHAPFGHPGDEGLAPFWARLRLVPAEQQAAVFIKEIFAGANAQAAFPGVLDTIRAWRPQLIVRDSVEFAALVAAEVAGVPHVRVAVHQRAAEEQACSLAAGPIDSLRQAVGLTADEGATLRAEKIFTSFPESFEGSAGGEAARLVYRVGPVKAVSSGASSGWEPNTDGLPLVYITFGTVATTVPEAQQLYRTAVAAVAGLPVRALLTTGRGFGLGILERVPANVRVEAWVPQAEVFPHTSVMVCHGGSGTVLGGLAACIPQVVVPLGADQPLNAQSIAAIGAGLALNKPDTATLRAAIDRVLRDPGFRDAARLVSREMSTLHSVDEAADALLDLAAP